MLIAAVFENNNWRDIDPSELSALGSGTQNAFRLICEALKCDQSDLYKQKIDTKGKLRNQSWSADSYLVFSGMGGSNPCAAWVAPGVFDPGKVVFDQTVYWAPVDTLDEAAYLAGAVNSPACAELIEPFQSKGQQGKRHIHKLPFAVTPKFDPDNAAHASLASATLALNESWRALRDSDEEVMKRTNPQSGSLATRRTWLMTRLRGLPEWQPYAEAAATLYEAA